MLSKQVALNKNFIDREFEAARLIEISNQNESAIVVVYGRRRVGKTELIEQSLHNRNLLKFEGVEKKTDREQKQIVLHQLSKYVEDSKIAKLNLNTWIEIFELIAEYTAKGIWTIYLEELQWLACYKDDLISELKYVWDNYFRHNSKLLLILCGSSPSFMINHVIKSKALYNRSMNEIPLKEFTLHQTKQFLPKRSLQEVMDAYLTIGGIPEYLKYLKKDSSVFISLCKNSFIDGAIFLGEPERIFVSSLGENIHYRETIEFLSKTRFATRNQIAQNLKIKSGGYLSKVLNDLELSGFIKRYTPYNLKSTSMLARYTISDNFLMYYFKFIHPITEDIKLGVYNKNPTKALNIDTYRKWLGFAFERFCRANHAAIAKILGFSDVSYKSGVYFNRATDQKQSGFQIDLLFDRQDKLLTICEVRYLQNKVSTSVIDEFEMKLERLPNIRKYTIQKVLISINGPTDSLKDRGYFDRFIQLEDFFE